MFTLHTAFVVLVFVKFLHISLLLSLRIEQSCRKYANTCCWEKRHCRNVLDKENRTDMCSKCFLFILSFILCLHDYFFFWCCHLLFSTQLFFNFSTQPVLVKICGSIILMPSLTNANRPWA